MPGRLTAGQLVQVRKPSARVFPIAKVSWPDVTSYYSEVGVPLSSARFGPISPRVDEWEDIAYSEPDYLAGLQGVQTSITLSDLDRTISDRMASRYRPSIEGCAVQIFFVTDDATNPDIVLFTGIIVEVQRVSTFRWKLILRVNDSALMQGAFALPIVDDYTYPQALADAGKVMPLPFGWFDSNDGSVAGSGGSLPAIRTGLSDGTGGFPYRYLASVNWLSSVKRVCVSGVALSNAAWVCRRVSARQTLAVTEIWLASDPGTSLVTYDCWGIGKDATDIYLNASYKYTYGTGQPIRNPTEQMRWLLLNHVFGAYRPTIIAAAAGLPVSYVIPAALTTGPLDATSWDAAIAFDEQRIFRGCVPPITDPSASPAQFFADWCRAWGKSPYWTPEGTLALSSSSDWNVEPTDLAATQYLRRVRTGTENAFAPVRTAKNQRIEKLTSAAWVVPSSGANRSPQVVMAGPVSNPKSDVFHNRFTEPAGNFDPTVMPSTTRVYLVDSAMQFGNTFLLNGAALTNLHALQFGATTLLETTGVNPPLFRAGVDPYLPNGRPYAEFSVANARWMFGQAGDSWGSMITASEHTIWVVFKFSNATRNDAIPNRNHPIITDKSGGFTGIYLKKVGASYFVYAHGWPGADCTTGAPEVFPNTWYIARSRHYGGVLYFSIDNFSETSVACGSLWSTAGLIALGGVVDVRGAIYSDVSVAAVVISNSGINTTQQGNETHPATPGLHDNYRIWSQLKDRYGI